MAPGRSLLLAAEQLLQDMPFPPHGRVRAPHPLAFLWGGACAILLCAAARPAAQGCERLLPTSMRCAQTLAGMLWAFVRLGHQPSQASLELTSRWTAGYLTDPRQVTAQLPPDDAPAAASCSPGG